MVSGSWILLVVGAMGALTMRGPCAAESMTAAYAVSWAGLDVGRFEVLLESGNGGYRASWKAATTGLVDTLFPFTSRGSAEGRREGDQFLPNIYAGRSEWRDGASQWRVAFAENGRATQIEVPADDLAGREPVPDALRMGPDPASLALTAIARVAPGVHQDGQSFDGRRAVAVALACAERDLTADLACTVSGRLLAGASSQWKERARSETEHEPWRVWLRSGVHGDGFWPVRLEAPSRFGTVAARLIGIDRMPAAG